MRSLRFRLAARVAGSITLALVAISLVSLAGARSFLDREIGSSLLNVASIQASSLTEAPGGAMRFHEWDLTPEEAVQVRELNRYAQVWSASGESLLRTQYITEDLPLDRAALRGAAAGRLVTTDQRFQGLPIRSLYYPLERMGAAHARHVLQVAAPLSGRDRMLRQLTWLLGAITVLVAGASFAGGWWLGGRMVRPVHEIIDQAEAMRPGTLGRRISADADTREYERLVHVLNGMLARLEAAFESQRRFTADASHELRGPLTALRGEVEVALRRDRDPAEYRRVLGSNLQEVERLTDLAADLLTLARSDAGVMQPRLQATDVAARAAAVVARLRARADEKDIRLDLQATADAEALVDPGLVEQLVWNLVENAIRFTPAGGRVDVVIGREGQDVVLEVRDRGPGLPEEDVERIFERFYRADPARTPGGDATGTGLGLSIVRAITDVHGGRVRALNAPDGGAVFRVTLPVDGRGARPVPAS
ncbi:MAG TPA: ATP-binding protein [Longimicrobiales bacterium]|nr:ATP-binding protein [Longimicrobiales bacterium]